MPARKSTSPKPPPDTLAAVIKESRRLRANSRQTRERLDELDRKIHAVAEGQRKPAK
jgi:hypothetical protein